MSSRIEDKGPAAIDFGSQKFTERTDRSIEMFVPFSVPPKYIRGVEPIGDKPPKYQLSRDDAKKTL